MRLAKDAKRLKKHNLMDYSLLLVIIEKQANGNNFMFSNSDYSFCFGVIDYLQRYNFSKKMERSWKGITTDTNNISAASSKKYAKRFMLKMNEIIR